MEIATELITTAAIVLIVHLFLRGFFPKKEIPFWLWCIGYLSYGAGLFILGRSQHPILNNVHLNDRVSKQKGGGLTVKVKWIFFDVGSTLVDETAAYDNRAREMLRGTEVTFSMFDCKRKELASMGYDGNSEAIKFFGLKKTPWPSEDEVLFSDAAETLEQLKRRGYHLGIIANQPLGTEKRLEARGVLKFFDVVAASAEMGIAKPDVRIFDRALAMAECEPRDSVMVGDRLDNDIIPAKSIGMHTVWIRKGTAIYQDRTCGKNAADCIIEELADLLAIF